MKNSATESKVEEEKTDTETFYIKYSWIEPEEKFILFESKIK